MHTQSILGAHPFYPQEVAVDHTKKNYKYKYTTSHHETSSESEMHITNPANVYFLFSLKSRAARQLEDVSFGISVLSLKTTETLSLQQQTQIF